MEQALSIQQVASATGLSSHTLRYYERCDLIAPIHRDQNGHRRYSAQDIRWIEFLTKLRMTGMPIRQIQQYAMLLRQQPDAVQERRALLEDHRQTVIDTLQKLQENLAVIDWKIQHYKDIEQKLADTFPSPDHSQTEA
ncbi:HTH-type transcriptional regulator AdhR [Acaryochloris thomasi RCC1774]|uniref:HTH-type transcriptional regulator AdhR n=1 Tax=Acaryochloris thomasi RCC1774 TaxID=1764569 RepID=A0A2W1JIP6_9CYAN|nr:MerR family transcriptional regulator [Acaryochloris thomasi]PZD73350.1 HTH-type transcriptional regulator AdhR [Acaryochloris thomasi RCC1774]